jgi:hypothetical protein
MSAPLSASKTFDNEFLGIRCRLIELAAALDRIDRAGGVIGDPRSSQIQESIQLLADGGPNRAERIQMAFSLKEI